MAQIQPRRHVSKRNCHRWQWLCNWLLSRKWWTGIIKFYPNSKELRLFTSIHMLFVAFCLCRIVAMPKWPVRHLILISRYITWCQLASNSNQLLCLLIQRFSSFLSQWHLWRPEAVHLDGVELLPVGGRQSTFFESFFFSSEPTCPCPPFHFQRPLSWSETEPCPFWRHPFWRRRGIRGDNWSSCSHNPFHIRGTDHRRLF